MCPYNKLSSALKTTYNILLILGQYRGGDYGAIIRVMVSVLLDVTQYLYTYLKSIKRPSHHQYYYKSYSKLAECVWLCMRYACVRLILVPLTAVFQPTPRSASTCPVNKWSGRLRTTRLDAGMRASAQVTSAHTHSITAKITTSSLSLSNNIL